MELLERLIEEARLHGRVALERDNALAALEKAGEALNLSNVQMRNAIQTIDSAEQTAKALRDKLHDSSNREQALLVALGDMSSAIDKFVRSGRKRSGKPYMALRTAKDEADKIAGVPF